MSFQIFNGVQGSPPVPEKKKEGVISFAYNTTTNNTISYLQLLGSNTIWVTGLSNDFDNLSTITLPSDANMIQLFDQEQVLVGCSRHINLYVDQRCNLAATTPARIVLANPGMYDLNLTVVSSTAVYVSCPQISGGPSTTSGNYIAPLSFYPITGFDDLTASRMVPPTGSRDLTLILTDANTTLPTASSIYTALFGSQASAYGSRIMVCRIFAYGGGASVNLTRADADTTFSVTVPLGTPEAVPDPTRTTLTTGNIYNATFFFTSTTQMVISGVLVGCNA